MCVLFVRLVVAVEFDGNVGLVLLWPPVFCVEGLPWEVQLVAGWDPLQRPHLC